MTSQNDRVKMELKFYFFIFVYLFDANERRPLTNKKYQNILFQSVVTMSKFVTKNRIYANFIVLYLRTESRYRRSESEKYSQSNFSTKKLAQCESIISQRVLKIREINT